LPVRILLRGGGILVASSFQKCAAQLFGIVRGEPESCREHTRLMSPAEVIRTQAIVAKLHDVHDGALAVGKLHRAVPSFTI
jgi:hypothetical protein